MTKSTKGSLLPIFVTVFLDMLGIGIIIPVIPALFFEADSSFFDPTISRDFRSITYGLLIGAFPFMQFFGAPILGALSDRFGRKPMIMVSLTGTMIGYLLFALAVALQNLPLLFLSRMLPGFFGGNISIVYAAIADVSDEQSRPKNFGLVGMSFGLGFILGPSLGGVLADDSVVSWFGPETPFLFTAALTLLNIGLVWRWFRETIEARRQTPLNPFQGFRNIAKSFSEPRLRTIFSVVLLLSLGFSFFTQFFSVLLIEKFSYSEKDIGFLFAWIGLWLVITQGVFVRRLSKIAAPKKILSFSILALGLALLSLLLPDESFWFFLLNPFVAIAQGITSPNLTTVVSVQAGAEYQGEVLGINQSMLSLGQIVPPLIAGYLNTISGSLPILAAGLIVLAGWLVYVFVFRKTA
ncbi:MAG: tetracycline resistance MFS efflux pump [Saprospirales bacterium]|nr:tetracycline resistance MFS efflux pump [Saprospirales bacterium]